MWFELLDLFWTDFSLFAYGLPIGDYGPMVCDHVLRRSWQLLAILLTLWWWCLALPKGKTSAKVSFWSNVHIRGEIGRREKGSKKNLPFSDLIQSIQDIRSQPPPCDGDYLFGPLKAGSSSGAECHFALAVGKTLHGGVTFCTALPVKHFTLIFPSTWRELKARDVTWPHLR